MASSDPQLIVAQAPAGYGKTTVLRELAQLSDLPIAWLDVTAADNEPRTFASALAAALSGLVNVALPAPGELETLRIAWIPQITNRLRESGSGARMLLVIDRYEQITDPTCHELTGWFLDAAGPGLRIMIGSRRKPPLRLARRLANGDVAIVGPAGLGLDAGAVRQRFELAGGAELTADELAAVVVWSRGWRVAVELAARAWAQRGSRLPNGEGGASQPDQAANVAGEPATDITELLHQVASASLADYVSEQVLAGRSEHERALLMTLAAVDRANVELARTLLEDRHWNLDRSQLDETRRLLVSLRDEHELVVQLDGDRGWLAVRPELRAPLVALLERAGEYSEALLRTRASSWFEQQGMIEEAIEQAVSAGDGDAVARLLTDHCLELVAQRRVATLRLALETATPGGALAGTDDLLRVLLLVTEGGDHEGLRELVRAILTAHPENQTIVTLATMLACAPGGGDVASAIETATAALERFGPGHPLAGEITGLLAFSLWLAGEPDRARSLLQPIVASDKPAHHRTVAYSVLALIAVHDREPRIAESYARIAVEMSSEPGHVETIDAALAQAALAESLRLAGKLRAAREALDEAQMLVAKGSLRHGLTLVFDAQLALAERRRGAARLSLARAAEITERFSDPGAGLAAMMAATAAALEQRADEANAGSKPTPAELRVLNALFRHNSRAQIARELFLSEDTVKSHLRRLYRRLGASSRDEALAAARSRGLGPGADDQ